jgi:hypothetical protein
VSPAGVWWPPATFHSGNVARDACVRALAVEVARGCSLAAVAMRCRRSTGARTSTAPPQLGIHGVISGMPPTSEMNRGLRSAAFVARLAFTRRITYHWMQMPDASHAPSESPDPAAAEVINLWPGLNLWRAPDWYAVHGIGLEGPAPTGNQLARMEAEVVTRRMAWRPSPAARAQLDMVRNSARGHQVIAKIWHSRIVELDETEGPHWIDARCDDVEVRRDNTGVEQAYLRLCGVTLIQLSSGWDARAEYLAAADQPGTSLLNLGDLYELQVI